MLQLGWDIGGARWADLGEPISTISLLSGELKNPRIFQIVFGLDVCEELHISWRKLTCGLVPLLMGL